MNQSHIRSLPLIIAALLPCATAQSAVISMDLYQPGDGLLTYDTINHREWLDLSQTDEQPLTAVEQSLQPGGTLFGFHRATVADVSAFVSSAGYVGIDPVSAQDYSIASQVIDLLGQNFNWVSDTYIPDPACGNQCSLATSFFVTETVARFASGSALGSTASTKIDTFTVETKINTFLASGVSMNLGTKIGTDVDLDGGLTQQTLGASWLYRDAPIPEPTTLTLYILTACAASLRWRRAIDKSHRD